MRKDFLLTPGPTTVPADVLLAMARPVIHHRTPQFQAILKEAMERAGRVLFTKNELAILTSSGTGAMEAAVANLASPGRQALTIEGGKFGARWGELCDAFGFDRVELEVEWGKAVDPAAVEKLLKENPSISAVFATHCETSTGTLHDIKALGEIVSGTDAVLVVDAISSAGACELRTDEWNVDVLCVGSQKGLMMPPGLALIVVSPKAKALMASAEGRRAYYFDVLKALESSAKADTPYTPAVSLVIGLNESLGMMEAEGVENVFRRHATLAEAVRAGARALGLGLLSERPSDSVTAMRMPEGIDSTALVKTLRDVEGVAFAGGQAALKGKIVRVATMGYCGKYDVMVAMAALEMGLAGAGHEVELGAGVRAAEAVLLGAS
ncbi:MAG: pyridoxal-phosphate-dependent aminotransferase family protein [Planctomycetota bacterium]